MAKLKIKNGNNVYSWKSDDIRDAEINGKLSLQYIGKSTEAGENERRPSFDFNGQVKGIYFCTLVDTNYDFWRSMCLVGFDGRNALGCIMSSEDSVIGGNGWQIDSPGVLSSNIMGWYSSFKVFRLLPDISTK